MVLLGHRTTMAVTLQNHSGNLNSTTCINAPQPQHELSHVFSKAPSGAVTICPAGPEGATDAQSSVVGSGLAPYTPALRRFFRVSLTSVLNPSLSLSDAQPSPVSLTSVLNSSSPLS